MATTNATLSEFDSLRAEDDESELGLFRYVYGGQLLRAAIFSNIDAQIKYLEKTRLANYSSLSGGPTRTVTRNLTNCGIGRWTEIDLCQETTNAP